MSTNTKISDYNSSVTIFNEHLLEKNYWLKLGVGLNIEKISYNKELNLTQKSINIIKNNLKILGYHHSKKPNFNSPIQDMKKIIKKVSSLGLPPVFSFVYDEFWYIQWQIKQVLDEILGKNYKQLPDFWAWNVDQGKSGWQPHRDKVGVSLFDNNEPKSVTVWIPLSVANPINSCMYVLPANKDKYYNNPIPSGGQISPLPGSLSDIKALPADPGDLLIWTQEVFHWGSSSLDNHDEESRISIAYEFQRNDVKPFRDFLLDPNTLPTFDERLVLISMQILQYTHMYGFKEDLVFWAQNCIERYKRINKL